MSHAERFADLYTTLREQSGWFGPEAMARASQAATLVLADRDDLVPELPGAMKRLGARIGWFSNLRGALGHSLVALALAKGIEPAALPDRVDTIKRQFKAEGVPRMGLWATAAAAWLALEDPAEAARAAPRMATILDEWKKDHPWITGHDDLHAAALHALGARSPEEVRALVEDRMVALEGAGFSWAPNTRQRAAQLAALRPSVSAERLGARFRALNEALARGGHRVRMVEREAVVLLATAPGEPEALARDFGAARGTLEAMKGSTWIGAEIRGVVTAGMVAADHGDTDADALTGATLAAIVAAIQAAAVATAGAAAAAG